jgi:hypothetical protein
VKTADVYALKKRKILRVFLIGFFGVLLVLHKTLFKNKIKL